MDIDMNIVLASTIGGLVACGICLVVICVIGARQNEAKKKRETETFITALAQVQAAAQAHTGVVTNT